jgi:hypothetical protein
MAVVNSEKLWFIMEFIWRMDFSQVALAIIKVGLYYRCTPALWILGRAAWSQALPLSKRPAVKMV